MKQLGLGILITGFFHRHVGPHTIKLPNCLVCGEVSILKLSMYCRNYPPGSSLPQHNVVRKQHSYGAQPQLDILACLWPQWGGLGMLVFYWCWIQLPSFIKHEMQMKHMTMAITVLLTCMTWTPLMCFLSNGSSDNCVCEAHAVGN